MDGIFDDLLPQQGAAPQPSAAAPGIFDDLVPSSDHVLTVQRDPGTTADLAVSAANGAALGFGPRIAAAGDTAVNDVRGWLGMGPMDGTSPDYGGNLQRYQDLVGQADAAHPVASKVAGLAGAVANPATYVLAPEALATTIGGKIAQVAGIGASLGAVQGAGDTPDLTNLPQTAKNVAVGSGLGLVAGGALPALARGYSGIANRFTGGAARAPLPGMGADATSYLMRQAQADGLDALQSRATQLGPDAMPLDLGPNLFGAGMAVGAVPGEGSTTVVNALNDRAAGTNARVNADVDAALGPAQNPSAVQGAIGDTRSAITGPLYQDAYSQGQLWGPQLDAISQRPAVQSALGDAATAAANQGAPLPSIVLDQATGQPVGSNAQLAAFEARTRPALDQSVSDLLGGDGSLATAAQIMAARQAAADPLYAQFRASDIPTSPALQELLQRPSVRAALPGAQRLAQDEGKSIYVPGSQWEVDPVPSSTTPSAPADMDFGPTDNGVRGTAPSTPDAPRPATLHDIVKSVGGVRDPGGDLKAMGLTDVPGLVAPPGKGLSPDAMRQAAAELGYLGPNIDDAMANSTIGDLHDALASDQPVYSVKDQGTVDAWNRYDVARDAWEQQGAPNSRAARPANVPSSSFDAGGPPSATAAPQITPEGWDYVKRALDDKISGAQRGGLGNEARVYTGLKGQLLDALDGASPVYAQARQAYAGQSDLLDALVGGRDALKGNVTREQMAADFGALGTDGERQMYRLGAAHALREQLAQRGDRANFVDTIAGNQALRDKLAVLAPSPEHLAQFNARVAQAGQQFTEATRPTVQGWHDTLNMLGSRAENQSGPQQAGTLSARDALIAELGRIPSFAKAQQVDADYGRLGDALDLGRSALRSGPSAIHPADYAAALAGLSPAEQAANRVGLRADIDRSLGVRSNDHQAVKTLLQGDDGWNGQKIGAAFGTDAQDALNRTVEREGVFSGSQNRIVQNSKTEPVRQAVEGLNGEAWEPKLPFKERVADTSLHGLALDMLVRKPANAIARALQSPPDLATRNAEIGRALTMQGGARDALFGAMDAKQRALMAQVLAGQQAQQLVTYARAPAAVMLAHALLSQHRDDRRQPRS